MKLIAAYLVAIVISCCPSRWCSPTADPPPPRTRAGNSASSSTPSAPSNPAATTPRTRTGASAAGAYQYITTTWRHWATRSRRLHRALPDRRHRTTDTSKTKSPASTSPRSSPTHDNNIDVVPVIWYYPAARQRPDDHGPDPDPVGRQHAHRPPVPDTMARHLQRQARRPPATNSPTCARDRRHRPMGAPTAHGSHSTVRCSTTPHHDYPALDLMIPAGTPVYAITGGTRRQHHHLARQLVERGCGSSRPAGGCSTCGIGITIQHPDGLRHTYCHNSAHPRHQRRPDRRRPTHRRLRRHRTLRRPPPPPRATHRRPTPLPPSPHDSDLQRHPPQTP